MCSVNSGYIYSDQNITPYKQACISLTFKCQILSLDQPQTPRLMPDKKQREIEHRFFPHASAKQQCPSACLPQSHQWQPTDTLTLPQSHQWQPTDTLTLPQSHQWQPADTLTLPPLVKSNTVEDVTSGISRTKGYLNIIIFRILGC
jgi:hypothetical protein